jgi:hypothetical protein
VEKNPGQISDAEGQDSDTDTDQCHLQESFFPAQILGDRDVEVEDIDDGDRIKEHHTERKVNIIEQKIGKDQNENCEHVG